MKVLLDTHILIWVLENNKSLSSHHNSILTDTNNEKIVSQISFMEMAIKINIGKLPDFKISLIDFIQQVEKDGFKILQVKNTHITTYASLSLVSDHRDPFDRFLIAIAILEDISIITVDEKFKAYQHLVNLI
ncbi:MAG: type II toxin-antitoxin system VapC family toxin [Ginsengibacter sp.]